jgi:hypothetical protein
MRVFVLFLQAIWGEVPRNGPGGLIFASEKRPFCESRPCGCELTQSKV